MCIGSYIRMYIYLVLEVRKGSIFVGDMIKFFPCLNTYKAYVLTPSDIEGDSYIDIPTYQLF